MRILLISLLFIPVVALGALKSVKNVLADGSGSPLPPGTSTAGGDSFGGGDTLDSRLITAWFYGTAPIQTCLQVTGVFGINTQQAQTQAEKAVQTWQKYFKEKKIGWNRPEKSRINTQFVIKEKCEGGEDLVLYLGTGPIFGNLDDLRARQFLSRPVAYVNKTHISEDYLWGKGYIRFLEAHSHQWNDTLSFPVWDDEKKFFSILLHDLGHVLGFQHTPETIMRKELAEEVFLKLGQIENFDSVDQKKELFLCESCSLQFSGKKTTNFPFDSVEIDGAGKVFFKDGGNPTEVRVDRVRKKKLPLSLFSHFHQEDYIQETLDLVYLSWGQRKFVLEMGADTIELVENSKTLGTFTRQKGGQ